LPDSGTLPVLCADCIAVKARSDFIMQGPVDIPFAEPDISSMEDSDPELSL
jgi:hypothetical protein